MQAKASKMNLISVAVIFLLLMSPMLVQADSIQYALGHEFSGAQNPGGEPPWLTAILEDIGDNKVELVLSGAGLIGREFVSKWFFNFDVEGMLATGLTFEHRDGIEATSIATTADDKASGFKADGDGYFDIRFEFGQNQFVQNSTSTYHITYSGSGVALQAAHFNSASQYGIPGNGNYYTAAHVQGIGVNGEGSGWVGDSDGGGGGGGGEIPEPGTLLLIGSGLVGFAVLRKKYRK